jgi:hypothetical protein
MSYSEQPFNLVINTAIEQLSELRDDGITYIKSKDISGFLQILEIQLDIVFDKQKVWVVTDSFINQYPNLLINVDLFLQFLNDLYKLDFVEAVEELILRKEVDGSKGFENEDVLGSDVFDSSPIKESSPITEREVNEQTKSINNDEYKKFEDESIKSLQNSIDEKLRVLSSSGPILERKEHKIQATATLEEGISKELSHKLSARLPWIGVVFFLIFLINLVLSVLLIFVILLITSSTTRRKILHVLLNNETSDLYWWQKVPFLERYVWEVLEMIRSYEIKGQ